MRSDENGASSEQLGQALDQIVRRIMEKQIKPMVLPMVRQQVRSMVVTIVQQEVVPVVEDLIRKVIKEALQEHVEERPSNGGTRNDLPEERSLQLKFVYDTVSDTVTGEELKGINDKWLKLVLVDSGGNTVTCGSGSDAKVEILLLDVNENGGEDNMSLENFDRRIIQTGEKKKPHFAKSVHISLKEGVADLNGLKLGHDKDRIKKYSCRLGARIAQNLDRTTVLEAWTAPFTVIDKHDKYNDKHPCPSLSSEVWRLDGIGRNGNPCGRLKKESIKTVQDFLFWFHVNPEKLQEKILCVGDCKWKTIVSHAQKCNIDCKRMFSHKSSTEPQTCVIYDAVGKLKGGIIESHFVPIDDMPSDEKDRARELLRYVLEEPSAFVERYDDFSEDEGSLLKKFPYRSLQHSVLTVSEDMNENHTSSSQSIIAANNSYACGPSGSLGSIEMGELSNSRAFSTDLHTLDYETPLCFENNSSPLNTLVSGNDKHTAEMGGGSSSGRSNASFQSARGQWVDEEEPYYPAPLSPEPMLPDVNSHNVTGGQWFEDEPNGPGSLSPDPMQLYDEHVDIHSAHVHGDETCGADRPKTLKKLSRLLSSFSRLVSGDAGPSCKKGRVD
ncbi:calmodulin-binding protein 60 A-like isoform X1 [Salvia splendens]|uniref:calmodulin-binding protein 60 A-like isoform X1 n=1 Tax=Salvia splendens TaxID=180675 RepID=UPI001C262D0A|nr:calmodulin-binding protein 60 A-like isoform X1 [Salvia splendens]